MLLLLQVSSMSGDLLVLAAGQARQMGRMVNVCPDALLDDGLLDFTLLFGSPGKQVRLSY
jgi:diacylglycerol kinase family enzyme